MLIAGISVLHVLVSHYAVGGGLFSGGRDGPRLSDARPRISRIPAPPCPVLHPADGRLRGDHRRGHLVDDRVEFASSHGDAHTHVCVRLGHGVGVLRRRVGIGLHLFLLLGPAAGEDARRDRLDLRRGGVDQPGVDYGHHGLHAQPGRLGRSSRACAELLDGVLQSAVLAADDCPHRRRAAP